jgi:hypothetical protein
MIALVQKGVSDTRSFRPSVKINVAARQNDAVFGTAGATIECFI